MRALLVGLVMGVVMAGCSSPTKEENRVYEDGNILTLTGFFKDCKVVTLQVPDNIRKNWGWNDSIYTKDFYVVEYNDSFNANTWIFFHRQHDSDYFFGEFSIPRGFIDFDNHRICFLKDNYSGDFFIEYRITLFE